MRSRDYTEFKQYATNRDTERKERQRQRERETDRHRETERERQTDRDRQTERESYLKRMEERRARPTPTQDTM